MQGAENGDDAGALNPERSVKLAAGDKFASVRFGSGAKLTGDRFGLVCVDARGLQRAGGGEGIECRGGNGVVSGRWPVDTLRHYLPQDDTNFSQLQTDLRLSQWTCRLLGANPGAWLRKAYRLP